MAVVAGTHQTGVNLMRNLSRKGVSVACVGFDQSEPGFQTVYGKAHRCPDPDEAPDEWVSFMTQLGRQLGDRPVLIPTSDQFVGALARHAEALGPCYRFHAPALLIQARLATKEHHYDIADAHGMPIPRTKLVRSSEDVVAFGAAALFPCLFKPLHVRHWERCPPGHPLHGVKVILAHSPEELVAKYRMCSEVTPELILQEVIEGPDTAKLVYISCYSRDGRRVGSCLVRELRTWPVGYGPATVVEPARDEEADRVCDQYLRRLGYSGICEIELKRDSRDGKLKLIEVNPRHSGTGDAAPYAGVEIGWLHYLDLLGVQLQEVFPRRRSFRHVVLTKDVTTLFNYWRAGLLDWRSVLNSYRLPLAFYDMHPRDWRLTVRYLRQILRVVAGQLWHGLKGRGSANRPA
jgi:D-aspartate ligase